MHCVLLASEDRGGKKTHKRGGRGGREKDVGRKRESGDSCTTPSFLLELQLSGDVSKSPISPSLIMVITPTSAMLICIA